MNIKVRKGLRGEKREAAPAKGSTKDVT